MLSFSHYYYCFFVMKLDSLLHQSKMNKNYQLQDYLEKYYTAQAGGGGDYFSGEAYQEGYGFGDFFRSAFSFLKPIGMKLFGVVKKELLNTGSNIISSALKGEDLKSAAQKHFKSAGRNLATKANEKIQSVLSGGRLSAANLRRLQRHTNIISARLGGRKRKVVKRKPTRKAKKTKKAVVKRRKTNIKARSRPRPHIRHDIFG